MSKLGRYAGKPLLRILECYVLWSIGELSESDETNLREIEPQLRRVLKQQGDWCEVIQKEMELSEDMPEIICAR